MMGLGKCISGFKHRSHFGYLAVSFQGGYMEATLLVGIPID